MKTLILVRHAKSSWNDVNLPDFDRPLNKRGKEDAKKMAERVHKKIKKIDAIISSPAKRAKKTAESFAEVFKIKEEHIQFNASLYHAAGSDFYEVIRELNNKSNIVAVFSHNPGITYFSNELITDINIDNVPTTGVFAVQMDINKWSDFKAAERQFLFFDYPKNTND
ncbi:MAG: histidine phosphatase family protein [Ginsengibacter sp.]